MEYSEYPPPADLSPYVRCYWMLNGRAAAGQPERVLPDGRIELVVHLGARFHLLDDHGRATLQPRCLLVGQMTRVSTLSVDGYASVFGVRFHPSGAAAFLAFPQSELRDQIVALDDVWGAAARQWMEALGNTPDTVARINLTNAFLRAHLRTRPPAASALARAIHTIVQTPGATVEDAARAARCSTRQLERAFLDHVGLTPKSWLRVARLQRALLIRREQPDVNWAAVAAMAGYYDHAHMAADFRKIAGAPPSQREAGETPMERCLVSEISKTDDPLAL